MRWYHWIWIAGFAVVAALGFLLGRRGSSGSVATEIKAIEAADKARKLEIALGTKNAIAEVEAEYDREIKAMDDDERKLAADLLSSPDKLAAFLVKVGGRRPL